MTASRISQRAVGIGMLLITVGFYWLIAKACDLASPRLKWFVIPAMVAMALLVFARSFTRDVKKYIDATHAYAHRDIDIAALPTTFRFITHDTTLQQVIDQLGPASRVVDLALRHRDGTQSTSRDTSMICLTVRLSSLCRSDHSSPKTRFAPFTCAKPPQMIGFQWSHSNVI